MTIADILAFVGQYGLPLTLLIVVVLDYRRERKRWEEAMTAERIRYEGIIAIERTKCSDEREEWSLERAARTEHERQIQERHQAYLLDVNKDAVRAIDALKRAAEIFEQERKEVRESRERELRDTGQHRPVQQRPPWKPPTGGGGE